jgi:hypothetical protein
MLVSFNPTPVTVDRWKGRAQEFLTVHLNHKIFIGQDSINVMTPPHSVNKGYIRLLIALDVSRFLGCELVERKIPIEMSKHMEHVAFIRCITDEPLVITKEVSLRLFLRHGTARMVTMIDYSLVVTATLRTKIPRNIFAIRSHLEDKLDSNSSQKLGPVVVSSVGIALFDPSDTSRLVGYLVAKDSSTRADVESYVFIV